MKLSFTRLRHPIDEVKDRFRKANVLTEPAHLPSGLLSNHLVWTVPRDQRTFVARVVEPGLYSPSTHGSIFEQVITELVSPTQHELEGNCESNFQAATPFDLLTFPEAFAPAASLVSVLGSLQRVRSFGCVHVGLRPDAEAHRHLFTNAEIADLITYLLAVPNIVENDLVAFRAWFAVQPSDLCFNLGCLFTVDMDAKVRLCLHPKLVRSRYEYNALSEQTMAEANLVSLVTLLPSDKRFLSVTIQPLICSDALNLATDRGTPPPIAAINGRENPLDAPPDHVDLVSLATHTPQARRRAVRADGVDREWHQDFRDVFCRAAQSGELSRHHFATFVFANFETLNGGGMGGLSGLFQPVDPGKENELPAGLTMSRYGRDEEHGNNGWWQSDEIGAGKWQWRGYIAALAPSRASDAAAVRIFGFSLASMVRDVSPWKSALGPGNCKILSAKWQTADRLAFSDWKERAND